MDITYLFLSFYFGVLIYLANQYEVERRRKISPGDSSVDQRATIVRWMLYGIVAMKFVFSLYIVQSAYLSTAGDVLAQLDLDLPAIDTTAALLNFGLALVLCYFSIRIIMAESTRIWLKERIGSSGIYNPDSSIHMVAIVLLLCFVSFIFDNLVGSGGLSGIAEQASQNSVSIFALVFQDVILVIGSFLGVGMAIRRGIPESLERLGLKIPTPQDILWGIGAGLLLFGATLVMVQIWSLFVPAEQIQEQSAASDELFKAFNTLPLALLLSGLAGISEEILFRGALQPIFGIWLVTLVFALSHIQYALTPATIIIFVVGLGLGWLRKQRNTTTAIIAHFVYDFVQLAISILVVQAVGGG